MTGNQKQLFLVIVGLAAAWVVAATPFSSFGSEANTGERTAAPPTASEEASSNANDRIVKSKSLLQVIRDGGPLMIPIGFCSFLLMVFIFERAIGLRKGRVIPGPFVKRFIDQLKEGDLDRDSAYEICEQNSSPVSQVFAAGVQKWGRPSVEVEQAILDSGERVSNELKRYLRLINGVATISPLLGLLGTVLGMIQAFDAIATVDGSAADPKVMIAVGISQALLTTAAGMSVAIPALIAYLFFVSRVDRRIMEIDSLGLDVVNLISSEALNGQTVKKKKSATASSRKSKSTKAA